MAKITRSTQSIFSGNIPPTNNIGVFGSLKAGSIAYSSDPTTIQSLAAWGLGWGGATVLNQAPALQDMNAAFYVHSYNLAYLLQQGVAEYSATQTYYTGSLCLSNSIIYVSVVDSNTGNALTNSAFWLPLVTKSVINASSNYSVVNSDYFVKCTGASAITVTLPAPSSTNIGEEHIVKNVLSAGLLVTVNAVGGGSVIDGQAAAYLSQYQSMRFICDGSAWNII